MGIGLFVFGGLMSPDIQRSELGRIPHCKEVSLVGWTRTWNVSLPPGFKIGESHTYIPESADDNLYPTFLNVIRDTSSFVVGKAMEITQEELKMFDEFEGTSDGVMARIDITDQVQDDQFDTVFVYSGRTTFVKYSEDAIAKNLAFIPQKYYDSVMLAKRHLKRELHKDDALNDQPLIPVLG